MLNGNIAIATLKVSLKKGWKSGHHNLGNPGNPGKTAASAVVYFRRVLKDNLANATLNASPKKRLENNPLWPARFKIRVQSSNA
jgi:hypothetical protein